MKRVLVLAAVGALGGCFTSVRDPVVAPAQQACPQPLAEQGPWRHRFGSGLVASMLGGPHHSAADVVVTPGQDAVIEGKFAYGPISKDLQDEEVTLWMQGGHCGPWAPVATTRTDGDGRIRVTVPAARLTGPGAHAFQLVVTGDGSRAHGVIVRTERDARAVVFDIDGTLTTGDTEVVEQVLWDAEPEMYPGAPAVARRYAEAGYLLVYITGRPYMMRQAARGWLDRNGFPPGILVTTRALGEAVPGAGGVGDYKERALSDLVSRPRIHLVTAYGNASTDVCAYARAGIPPTATYIIGKHGGTACTGYQRTRTITSYLEHLPELEGTLGGGSGPVAVPAGAEP